MEKREKREREGKRQGDGGESRVEEWRDKRREEDGELSDNGEFSLTVPDPLLECRYWARTR